MSGGTARQRPDGAWVAGAVEHFNGRSELVALKKCVQGDGDVRVVYSMRRNALIIETVDFAEQTVIEIFREDLVPWLGGLELPETDEKQ